MHRNMIHIHVFIKMSNYICINIYICTIFKKEMKSETEQAGAAVVRMVGLDHMPQNNLRYFLVGIGPHTTLSLERFPLLYSPPNFQ
jgi:hypothetical protein